MEKIIKKNILWVWWRSIDQQAIMALALLFAFSLMLVTTSSPAVANRIGLEATYFSTRHTIYLALSAGIIFSISLASRLMLRRLAIVGFAGSLACLILVKFYGFDVKGARRWINILGFSMQPSEFIKPFFAIITAWIFSFEKKNFPSFTISSILYIIIALALVTQPDLGMLVMVTAIWGVQLFLAGLPIFWIILAMISGAIGILFAYKLLPHAAQRIDSFLDPANNANYQVSKSLKAFEQGGLYGAGPGEGSVKQVLPDSHADFIFAVAGEEFGAIICLIIAAIFAFIVIRGLILLLDEDDKFTILAVAGILCQFGLQAIVNMGVALNMLPTKGMTLPFISYGGSSTLAIGIGIGMFLSLTKRRIGMSQYKHQMLEL